MKRFLVALSAVLALAWAGVANADSLGQTTEFRVNSGYDAAGDGTIDATLRAVGAQSYLYVDDRYWSSLSGSERNEYQSDLEDLADLFDRAIRPSSVAFWGTEATPGVDGDPRVTVLLEQLIPGNGGYFETIHSYPRNQAPESNAREMVFVSATSVTTGLARDFLTHEFQHLISFNQRELLLQAADDVWMNELRSEYNVTIAGLSVPYSGSALQRRALGFIREPSDSLTEWPNTATDYTIASLFGHYLADRYGGAVLQHTIHTRARGVRAVNEWLQQRSTSERFREVFADWMAAVIVNDARDPRYGYATTGLNTIRLTPTLSARLDADSLEQWDLRLKAWQPEWIRMNMPSGALPPTVTVSVSGQSNLDWGGTAIADYSGNSTVIPWRASGGIATLGIPTQANGAALRNITFTITHGTDEPVTSRMFESQSVTVTATFDTSIAPAIPLPPSGGSTAVRDGDLIRHNTEKEVYVVWGNYRRYLVPGILELYGFQNRPVISVNDDTFNRYTTSNYIRQVDTEPVYAVWPDGTKHHFAITAAQWDAAGRDWNAIFIVNDREAAFYRTGEDITR